MLFIKDAIRVLRYGQEKKTPFKELIIEDEIENVYRLKYEEQLRNEIAYLRSVLSIPSGDQLSHLAPKREEKSIEDYKDVKVRGGYTPFGSLKLGLERKLRDRKDKEVSVKAKEE